MYGFITCLAITGVFLFGLYKWYCSSPEPKVHKTIVESKLFKIALLAPVALSTLVAGIIFLLIDGKFNFGISGIDSFKNFYEIFKIPLSLIAASPVTAGIAAIIHRSEETAKQIELSNKQIEFSSKQIEFSNKQYQETLEKNTFEKYIKHRDDFCKRINPSGSPYESVITSLLFPNSVYSVFFPNNNYLNINFTPDQTQLKQLNLLYSSYLTKLVALEYTHRYLFSVSAFTHNVKPIFKHTLYKTLNYKDTNANIYIACTAEHEHSISICNERCSLEKSLMESLKCIYNLVSTMLSVLDPDFKPISFCEQNVTNAIDYLKKENINLEYLPPP